MGSQKIFEDINGLEGIAWSLHVLGNIEQDAGAFDKAIPYYQQSLQIFKEIGEQGSVAETLNALGTAYLAPGAYQEARQTYLESLQMATQIQARPVAMYTLTGYATTLIEAGGYGESEDNRRAVELLFFVLGNPASDRETRDKAEHLLAELKLHLPPEIVAAAK